MQRRTREASKSVFSRITYNKTGRLGVIQEYGEKEQQQRYPRNYIYVLVIDDQNHVQKEEDERILNYLEGEGLHLYLYL